ncbi:MAG: hypothetical protein HUU15_05080 [Candidatus Brocadiae bacterium]|nr:hypothetical protein [Candidatus Brocadiia bacterium]
MRAVSTLMTLLLVSAWARAGNCDACMETAMCIRHSKEETEALKVWNRDKSKKDPMVRKAALDQLGKLNNDHLNCRHEKVAEAIADALTDVDTGIRDAARGYLATNQERRTAMAELTKLAEKLIAKLGKPRPGGRSGNSEAGLEWDNQLAFLKSVLDSLAGFGDPDVVPTFEKAIRSSNVMLAVAAAKSSMPIRSRVLVEAMLDKASLIADKKDPDSQGALKELALYVNGASGFGEALGDDGPAWLKAARKFWSGQKGSFVETPDPDAPPPGEPK